MQLRGASADALAALSDQLEGALRGGADAARVGSDLFAVAGLLRSEPGLRRVATDVSVDAAAKQRLVSGLLEGKVAPETVQLVSDAVGRRWTAARDLGDSLEHLGEVAVVRSAGDDSGRLSDELFAVAQTFDESPELRHAFSDPARSTEDKQGLVRDLLGTKALPATTTLVEQALAGTYRTVGVALSSYQEVAAQVHGERVATVRVAHPLSDSDRQRLTDALSRQYDRPVHLNVVVDPDVIGGIRVEIGNHVIDGTVASRLDDARRRLAG
jgi:F-type H+-transporting ATPase subunit delta